LERENGNDSGQLLWQRTGRYIIKLQFMPVRIANLICASVAFLSMTMATCGVRAWAGSPPVRPHPMTARGLIMDLIALCWFAGAVGLFFRKRLAWVGSVIGTGASVCFWAAALVTGMGLFLFPDLFPNAQMERLRSSGLAGYNIAIVFALIYLSVLLAISLGLFIGLLRKRKELLGR
jgi:hypothetical protein